MQGGGTECRGGEKGRETRAEIEGREKLTGQRRVQRGGIQGVTESEEESESEEGELLPQTRTEGNEEGGVRGGRKREDSS
jgi:hypothetical protein